MSIITTHAAVTAHQVEVRHATPVKVVQPVKVVERKPIERQPIVVDRKPIVVDHHDHDRDYGHGPVIIEHDRPVVTVITPVTYQSPYSTGYVYAPQPMTVLGATALDGTQLTVAVNNELGGMCQLDLDATGTGATYVSSVVLTYDTGAQQVVAVNQLIDANNPQFQIPLNADAGAIMNVSVVGHSNWGGALTIAAR
jgi:hypothetical protein